MEIGSFIELQFPKGKEWYSGGNVLRLNTGRAAIYHSLVLTGCKTLWLPYYQCESVKKFLKAYNVNLKFYHITFDFEPTADLKPKDGEAVLLVNYFGVRSALEMQEIASRYDNAIIIDNSQAFFCQPIDFA